MQSMKGHTTGKDICTKLINCVNKKLANSFTNLVAFCNDVVPAVCGKHTGAVSLIQEVIERRIITHHCIIHHQALCDKICKFDHVMSVVALVVIYLRARALKHRTFRGYLEKAHAEYKDLVYHTEVRGLSRGRVLQRFVALKEKVLPFLKNEPKKFEELESESWNHDLYFLCDITAHLNDLNTQLQGKDLLIFLVGKSSDSFQNKTTTFQKSVVERSNDPFSYMCTIISQCQHLELGEKFAQQIEILMQEFDQRFTLSQEENLQFKLVEDPFSMDPEEELTQLQLDVIGLQASSVCKTKGRESSLPDFYRSLN